MGVEGFSKQQEEQTEKKENTQLLKIRGKDIEKYNSALSCLGYKPIKLKSFSIDRSGYSAEVAKVRGKDYLKNNIIIVSNKQEKTGLMRKDYSFLNEFMNKLYSTSFDLISKITEKEALYGDLEIIANLQDHPRLEEGIYSKLTNNSQDSDKFKEMAEKINNEKIDPNSNFVVIGYLNTPKKTITKLGNVVKKINKLDENNDLILRKDYLNDILKEISSLNKIYGNLRGLGVENLPLSIGVPSFELKRKDYEIYGIGKKDISFIYFGKENEKCPGVAVDGSKKDILLEKLLNENYVEVNEDYIKQTLWEIEDETLNKIGTNTEGMDLMDRYRMLEKNKDELCKKKKFGEFWKVLKDKSYFVDIESKYKPKILSQESEDVVLTSLLKKVGCRENLLKKIEEKKKKEEQERQPVSEYDERKDIHPCTK